MRRLTLVLVLALLASTVYAAQVYTASGEVQANSRESPRVDAPAEAEKVRLVGVKKLRVTLCTCSTEACAGGAYPDETTNWASGGHLSGGAVTLWYQHPDAGWVENPDLRLSVGVVDGGCRTWGDIFSPAANSKGYVMGATLGVTRVMGDGGNWNKLLIEGITYE